ncbi:MAG: nuclear transport factor 2 family protein [Pseudomonadota bacterium]
MTNTTILERDAAINAAILNGTALDAFDQYYADDVVMQENDQPATAGKALNRQREEDFFGAITEFRGATLIETGAGDNVTFSRWLYDYTHAEWGERRYHQVVVRTWRDGLVVAERFYYG